MLTCYLGSSPVQRAEMQLETEGEQSTETDPGYCPRHALTIALTDWYEEMRKDARVSAKKLTLPPVQPSIPPNPTVCPPSPTSLPIVPGVANLNELNNLEINSSYQQPAMSAVPLNSFVDSDVDSDDSISEPGRYSSYYDISVKSIIFPKLLMIDDICIPAV